MRFVVDAQLPRRMVHWLQRAGHDAIHTLDLPNGNRTSDEALILLADSETRVLITKDRDFESLHLSDNRPAMLLLISTGNMSNQDLERAFVPELAGMVDEFRANSFLELTASGIVVRG